MFVYVSTSGETEPRLGAQNSAMFAVNVEAQRAGAAAVIDQSTLGFPPTSLKDVPAGDYYVQALLNMGAVIGMLPVTGVPLPFVSFGGSALVFTMIAAGVLANVARQSR